MILLNSFNWLGADCTWNLCGFWEGWKAQGTLHGLCECPPLHSLCSGDNRACYLPAPHPWDKREQGGGGWRPCHLTSGAGLTQWGQQATTSGLLTSVSTRQNSSPRHHTAPDVPKLDNWALHLLVDFGRELKLHRVTFSHIQAHQAFYSSAALPCFCRFSCGWFNKWILFTPKIHTQLFNNSFNEMFSLWQIKKIW